MNNAPPGCTTSPALTLRWLTTPLNGAVILVLSKFFCALASCAFALSSVALALENRLPCRF